MPVLESRIDLRSDALQSNARGMAALLADLDAQLERAAAGGGDAARA